MSKTEEFIQKAIFVHGDCYDYSKTVYINCHTKVYIICKIHGGFWQYPWNHLQGMCGCKDCHKIVLSKNKKSNTDVFITKANKVHKNKYDYSEVVYIDARTDVKIICPIHGEFWQKPYLHLLGSGCKICGRIKISESRKDTLEEFIEKSNLIHKNKYNYGEIIDYEGARSHVDIICPIHGKFSQLAANHLKGCGCPICAQELCANLFSIKEEEFIKRAKKIHGDEYTYDNLGFISMSEKVTVFCKKHGFFSVFPWIHLNGGDCPICYPTGSKSEMEFLKYVQSIEPTAIKAERNTVIPRQELDVYIPEKKIAFEFNGEYWHDTHIDQFERDQRKEQECIKKGIKLYTVWYKDWIKNPEQVKETVRKILTP